MLFVSDVCRTTTTKISNGGCSQCFCVIACFWNHFNLVSRAITNFVLSVKAFYVSWKLFVLSSARSTWCWEVLGRSKMQASFSGTNKVLWHSSCSKAEAFCFLSYTSAIWRPLSESSSASHKWQLGQLLNWKELSGESNVSVFGIFRGHRFLGHRKWMYR